MKVAFFSAKQYEIEILLAQPHTQHEFHFIPEPLSEKTAYLAENFDVVCCFVTDVLNIATIKKLAHYQIKLIALRSSGFDYVDLSATQQHNIPVVYVPRPSPASIAEFATGLLLSLTRRIPQAIHKTITHNYTHDGLIGFDLFQKTVGIIGGGSIGTAFAKCMLGMGATVIVVDPNESAECFEKKLPVEKVDLNTLCARSDVISLNAPLNASTKYMINDLTISKMKKGVIILNTARGALIDTLSLIRGLESKHISAVALDVYEYEYGLYASNRSHQKINDKVLLKLQSLDNVIMTGHIAFLSQESIKNIARITLENIDAFAKNQLINSVQ